jgi:hypothetical protein
VGREVFITKTNVFSWWLLRPPPCHGLNTRAIRLQLKVLVFSFLKSDFKSTANGFPHIHFKNRQIGVHIKN